MTPDEWLSRYHRSPNMRHMVAGEVEIDINNASLNDYVDFAVREVLIELPTGKHKIVGYYKNRNSSTVTVTIFLRII